MTDVPNVSYDVPRLLILESLIADYKLNHSLFTYNDYIKNNFDILKIFSDLKENKNITIVNLESKFFDNNGNVITVSKNMPLYLDDNHLTAYGAYFSSSVFNNSFNDMKIYNKSKNELNK